MLFRPVSRECVCDQEWDLASQLALKLPENRIDVLPRNLLFWRQGPIKWDLELRKASEFTVVHRCSHFHDKKLDSKLVLAFRAKWDLACFTDRDASSQFNPTLGLIWLTMKHEKLQNAKMSTMAAERTVLPYGAPLLSPHQGL